MRAAPELVVVIPTYRELQNIEPLVSRLEHVLAGFAWEAIFVDDDSPDGTAEALRRLGRQRPHIRVVHRIKRRGLSSAVIEGIQASNAPLIAVMDADMQHDEALLPKMLATLKESDVDVVVGSRYMAGGSTGGWSGRRARMSRIATRLSRLVISNELSDPMSGFFMIRRESFLAAVRNLSGEGYKILLDILASSPRPLQVAELPYEFRARRFGESKVDGAVLWEYVLLLVDKLAGRIVPVRFVMFGVVGGSGVLVHMIALAVLFRSVGAGFEVAQTAATFVAMTSNFILNNRLTYRDRRLRGFGFVKGLLSFYAVCTVGVVGNVGVASVLFERHPTWWLAGIAGILVGTVWNYAVTAVFTWRTRW